MSNEMIERVARKLSEANHEGRVWGELVESQRNFWRTQAREAINAMREPTREMILATSLFKFQEGSMTEDFIINSARETWYKMIDEVMK